MDDWLAGLLFGLLGLFGLNFGVEPRAEQGARQQVQEAFHHSGSVQVKVTPRGVLGLLFNELWAVDISAQGLRTDSLPFVIEPRGGWKGRIRHLRLHFTDFMLRGYRVDRFDVDLPFVKYDLGHALYRNRLVFRSAGTGPADVLLTTDSLRYFLERKYPNLLSSVEVWIQGHRLYLRGKVRFLGASLPLLVSGEPLLREGRYLDLDPKSVYLANKMIPVEQSVSLLNSFHPILDTYRDLSLDNLFVITDISVNGGGVLLHGNVTLPIQTPASPGKKGP